MNAFKVNNRKVYELSNVSKIEQVLVKTGIVVFAVVINICLFELYFK